MTTIPIKDRLQQPLRGADSRHVRKVLLDYAVDNNYDAADIKNPTSLAKALLPRLAEEGSTFEGLIAGNQLWLKSAARKSLVELLHNQLKAGGKSALHIAVDRDKSTLVQKFVVARANPLLRSTRLPSGSA